MCLDGIFDCELVEVVLAADRVEFALVRLVETDPREAARSAVEGQCAFQLERLRVACSGVIVGGVDDHESASPKCRSRMVFNRSSPVPATNHHPPTASEPSVKTARVAR